jgi:signal transduction histidine kinase/CheY-like chemotaxis protein
MNLIDPDEPTDVRIARQERIIAALMRRADRRDEMNLSAYGAFQSAIELQAQVAAKTRDLEEVATELETVRGDRARTQRNLHDALSVMQEGFALFTDGHLNVCNQLFRTVLPDIAGEIVAGLTLDGYFDLMVRSRHLVSTDHKIHHPASQLKKTPDGAMAMSLMIELAGDIWYQLGLQRTSPDNVVLLLTEVTPIVRQNRSEKKTLIDQQADYLQAVFETMTSGVCTFSPQGTVMMQNRQFRQLLGVPLAELQPGTTLERLLAFMQAHGLVRDDAFLEIANWQQQLTQGGWLRRVRHGRGRMLDVQVNGLPDGGFLVEVKDVTLESRATELLENRVLERTAELTRANERLTEQFEEKARVEEELRLAKERAEAAVSSKTRFLAAASHDLLQPINAAKLLISTLQEAAQGSHLLPMVDRLHRAFTSTEQLLHALLDISRLSSSDPDAVTPTEVDLGALMEGVFADQLPLSEFREVRLDVVPCRVVVRSDPVYLHRSVQNLVVNAIQYTEAGGRVLLGARRRGSKVVLEVRDTGIGIDHVDQKRIFEEFARAENAVFGTGMGLGLSVVDRTCRHLGHALSLRSAPGRGSVFSIELERAGNGTARADPATRVQGKADTAFDHTVLVIENDAEVLFATRQRLERWGARVLGVPSTPEACCTLDETGVVPDIVLADYHLDGDDTGLAAVAALRDGTGHHLPAILITADRSELLRRMAAREDVSVISKPVKLSRLRPLIDWAIQRHRGGGQGG